MRAGITSVLAASALLLVAAPIQAQVPGIDLKLNPRIGYYTPLTDLADVVADGQDVLVEQSGSLAIGLGAELALPMLPIDLRLNLDYATGADIEATVDNVAIDPVETTLLAVVGDVIFRPLPNMVLIQPYLFAGGGIKQYDYDLTGGEELFADDSDSDPTIHIGGGFDVGFGPLAVNAEIGDYISWYEIDPAFDSEMQHDLFLTVGFSIGLL